MVTKTTQMQDLDLALGHLQDRLQDLDLALGHLPAPVRDPLLALGQVQDRLQGLDLALALLRHQIQALDPAQGHPLGLGLLPAPLIMTHPAKAPKAKILTLVAGKDIRPTGGDAD